jgi:hypothetical protein
MWSDALWRLKLEAELDERDAGRVRRRRLKTARSTKD